MVIDLLQAMSWTTPTARYCIINESRNHICDFMVQNVLEGNGRSYFSLDSIETDDIVEQ